MVKSCCNFDLKKLLHIACMHLDPLKHMQDDGWQKQNRMFERNRVFCVAFTFRRVNCTLQLVVWLTPLCVWVSKISRPVIVTLM